VSEVDISEPKPVAPLASAADGLDVKIAAGLLERARAEGVSLVGQGGLLQQVTRAVLQAALEAEMADHLGYERGETPPVGSTKGTAPALVDSTKPGAVPTGTGTADQPRLTNQAQRNATMRTLPDSRVDGATPARQARPATAGVLARG
jgi:hypothetical protein